MTISRSTPSISMVLAATLGTIVAILLSTAWSAAWAGFTLSILWGWFVVPLFSVPALSVGHAYGLVLVFRCTQGLNRTEKSEPSLGKSIAKSLVLAPFIAGLFLLFGWAASRLI